MSRLSLGVAQRAAVGQTVCGDAYLHLNDGKSSLLAVIDGAGHGPGAAEAAAAFCDIVCHNVGLPLTELLDRGHHGLKGTRGAAVALLRINQDEPSMTFAGVGNIEIKARSETAIHPVSTRGILGRRMGRVRDNHYPLTRGDLVVVHSDGISSRFDLGPLASLASQDLANRVLEHHRKEHDDATCLVFRVE